MIQSRARRGAGFALIEALAMMISLGAGMALGGAALILALQTERAADQTHRTLVERRALAEQFRADVNRATATLDQAVIGADEVVASPTCLILEQPGEEQVVYLWLSGRLERVEVKGDKTLWRTLPVGVGVAGLEFTRPAGRDGLVTLRLRLATRKGSMERHVELSAALGGDWR
jgi:hypothetical protein